MEDNQRVDESSYKVFMNQEAPKPDGLWTDDLFPPNETSLSGVIEANKSKLDVSDIEWKRSTDIFPQPFLFEGSISVADIVQGKIGNCYFLSAIASLCEFPGLITQIFLTKEYNPNGYYKLLLFIDGEYQIVYVDDYFPCLKGTDIPYFAKPNSFELWAMLLEKAWAKINRGYANIISGWPCDVFRVFTGFACEELNLNEEKEERVWGILKAVDKSAGLICVSTKGSDDVVNAGLVPHHSYTYIESLELEDDNKNIVRLCKVRNPWGTSNWNGDWSERSEKWTENLKKYSKREDGGVFFISIQDLMKYFIRVDICQMIYDGFVQTFDFNQSDLNEPQVFNFFVHKHRKVSVSVIEKNWRYHPELTNVSHPTSLVLAEYDPTLKVLKRIHCDFESYNDTEKSRTLNPGYYILWVYKGLAQSEDPKPESMKVRICSESKISIKHLGPDKGFEIIQQIVYQGVKLIKADEIKNDEIFYDFSNDFKRSGLGYRLVINPLSTAYQKWDVDTTGSEGYSILPPYADQEKFSFNVSPNNFAIVLAIKKKKYGTFCFNLNSEIEQYECREGEDPFPVKRPPFDTFCLGDVNTISPVTAKISKSFEELSKKPEFPVANHSELFASKYKDITPLIKDYLIKMPPQPEGKKKLGWVKLQKNNGLYFGEADYATPQGRGCFIFNKDGLIWIGYFDDGTKGHYGNLYEKDGTLIYQGDYKNGLRNGYGIYYYPGGLRYEGNFVNGIREGKGTFYWDDGTSWEGTFKNNEMDGEGTFYDGDDSFPATYSNGDLVE